MNTYIDDKESKALIETLLPALIDLAADIKENDWGNAWLRIQPIELSIHDELYRQAGVCKHDIER